MTTKTNRWLNQLGLAMRAGKLVTGDEGVLEAIRKGEAKLVLLAEDASDNTQKKFRDKCASFGAPLLIKGTRSELGGSIGKPERVVIAVTDPGFARLIANSQANPAEVE